MHYYPINLALQGRRCLVVGGGAVAQRKVQTLVAAEAAVFVLSPDLTPCLAEMAAAGRIWHIADHYQPGVVKDYFLVICATDDAVVNRLAAEEARQAGALVNVVDSPEQGDFTVPAQIVRGDLVIAVSTGGKSPALARSLCRELAEQIGPEYGTYLELLANLRQEMKQQLATAERRREFWQAALDAEMLALLRAGRIQEAEERIRYAARSFGTES